MLTQLGILWGEELTNTPINISDEPVSFSIDSNDMNVIKKFILQYDPKSMCHTLEEARKEMFIKQLKSLEDILPTEPAAYQHIRRAVLPTYEIYQSLEKQAVYLETDDFGWVQNERLKV